MGKLFNEMTIDACRPLPSQPVLLLLQQRTQADKLDSHHTNSTIHLSATQYILICTVSRGCPSVSRATKSKIKQLPLPRGYIFGGKYCMEDIGSFFLLARKPLTYPLHSQTVTYRRMNAFEYDIVSSIRYVKYSCGRSAAAITTKHATTMTMTAGFRYPITP